MDPNSDSNSSAFGPSNTHANVPDIPIGYAVTPALSGQPQDEMAKSRASNSSGVDPKPRRTLKPSKPAGKHISLRESYILYGMATEKVLGRPRKRGETGTELAVPPSQKQAAAAGPAAEGSGAATRQAARPLLVPIEDGSGASAPAQAGTNQDENGNDSSDEERPAP